MDRERARIARDLHDDLGHGLTQIVLLSDLTSTEQTSENELQGLQQIASTAKRGIRSLDEAVWAINPRNDTLPDLIDYLAHFVMQSLRSAGIQYQMDLPDHPPELTVPSETRHGLFLTVKEAMNNILRHADATSVALTIALEDRDLVITLADDGRGFATRNGAAGQDGLRNMSQRMNEIGGVFRANSAPAPEHEFQSEFGFQAISPPPRLTPRHVTRSRMSINVSIVEDHAETRASIVALFATGAWLEMSPGLSDRGSCFATCPSPSARCIAGRYSFAPDVRH